MNSKEISRRADQMIANGAFDLDRLYFLLGLKPVLRVEIKRRKTASRMLSGLRLFKKYRYRRFIFVSRDDDKASLAQKLTILGECRSLEDREKKKRDLARQFGIHLKPAITKTQRSKLGCREETSETMTRPPETEHIAIETLLGRLYGYPKCCVDYFAKSNQALPFNAKGSRRAYPEKVRFNYAGISLQLIHIPCSKTCEGSKKLIKMVHSRLARARLNKETLSRLCDG